MSIHPDGVYFDLDEDEYHSSHALGSTDLRRLLASGPDYWWHSSLNPNRPDDSGATPSLEFGKALHRMVLEGEQAFTSRFVRRPEELARLDARARAQLAPNGESVLEGDDYDRIALAGELIRQNPDLASAFEGGASEVSIFWREEIEGSEIRLKARFDYLKLRGIGDLKSIRNPLKLPFPQACARAIASYRYDVQAAHYLIARAHLAELVSHDLVFGDHNRDWLKRVAATAEYGFQFVFFQAESAPITWSRSLSFGNPILEIAMRDRTQALAMYQIYKQKFGADAMWLLEPDLRELDIEELPRWYR
jgi:hypothetical protein